MKEETIERFEKETGWELCSKPHIGFSKWSKNPSAWYDSSSYYKALAEWLEGENKQLKQQIEDAKRKVSDTLNWVKSELKQEEHSKLSKTMSPYRTDKIKFLRRTINHLNQEG